MTTNPVGAFRPRRLRQYEAWRALIRETRLSAEQLIMPLFVRPGTRIRSPIASMPGQFQLSVDQLVSECRELSEQRIGAILLFGIPDRKDELGRGAYARDGIVQQAVRALKAQVPDLLVITDVCLCAYTTHGHCGVVKFARGSPAPAIAIGGPGGLARPGNRDRRAGGARGKKTRKGKPTAQSPQPRAERDFYIDNDATLGLLVKTVLSHAQAGADMVAPSDMMDGTIGAIRRSLDDNGWERLPIMGYSAKFASSFYGPFRQAVDSAPAFSDRRSYQMDIANAEEALREARLDLEQGADLIMVKPALAYLDVIRRIKEAFHHPVAAFNVSGEYAMVKAAAARGWLMERSAWFEILLAMKRAGADVLITYWAKDAAKLLRER